MAQQTVAGLLKPPTQNTIQTPLKETPPTGKTIVYMQCTDGPQCVQIGQGLQAAAAAAGWNVKTLSFQLANPATLVAGLQTALQYHPAATVFLGPPYATWSSVVPAYTSAKVALLPIGVGPAPTSSTLLPEVNGIPYREQVADALANWVVADSNGKAHILLLDVPAFAVLSSFVSSFKATVSSRCPDCSVSLVNATVPQFDANQLNGVIETAIQKDPSINYFVSPDAFINGLPQALAGAGLANRVKIAGNSYGTEQIADIKAGTESAWIGTPIEYFGWLAMDSILRDTQGMAVQANAALPTQLITKANVDSLKSTEYYNPPFDYQAQFSKIWKVG
jgi:ribose transport system substrate-binding protein